MTGSVHTERPQYSPSERATRVRRCARAIKQGAKIKDLKAIYTYTEIEDAKRMLEGS